MSISNEVITILDDLGKRFGVAVDWSNQNITPYLKELCGRFINWNITTSVVWMVIAILILALCVIYIIVNLKALMNNTSIDEICEFFFAVSVVAGVICLFIIGSQIFDICRCVYMPELEIYNYISEHF